MCVGLTLELGVGSCSVTSEMVGKSQGPSTKTLTSMMLPTFCHWAGFTPSALWLLEMWPNSHLP